MKKYTPGFLAISCVLPLSAMEFELTNLSQRSSSINGYGSLTENIFSTIQEQKRELSKSLLVNPVRAYLDEFHASFKLDQVYKSFAALPEKCKRAAMRTMSLQLLYAHALALCLPPEIIKNHIIRLMLDDEGDAVEQFYTLSSFTQAFDVYHEIKTSKKNDDHSIGSVFAKYCKARDLISKALTNSWYSYVPIISQEDIAKIESLDAHIKNSFLHERGIFVTDREIGMYDKSEHFCHKTLHWPWCPVVAGVGVVVCGGMFISGLTVLAVKSSVLPSLPLLIVGLGGTLGFAMPLVCSIDKESTRPYREKIVTLICKEEI